MKEQIRDSELILNADGSVYHLNLHPAELADTVIVVGDPGRVATISKYFDNIELMKQKREIVTHTGTYKGKRLTVMSTGMGTDNIDIVFNELDALVNIDLKERVVKDEISKLNIVRFGTSGALQPEIPVDSYVVSTHGVGLDILLQYYQREVNDEEALLTKELKAHLGEYTENLFPVIVGGCSELIDLFSDKCFKGMTATAAGFYGPQGRVLRAQLAMPGLIDKLPSFKCGEHRITNFEMETSAIYGLGHRILGHNCCSVNLIVVNRENKTHSERAAESMEEMIQMGLDKLSAL